MIIGRESCSRPHSGGEQSSAPRPGKVNARAVVSCELVSASLNLDGSGQPARGGEASIGREASIIRSVRTLRGERRQRARKESSGTETEAGTESQTTEAVSLLQSLRSGEPQRCAGSCLGSGTAQRRSARSRWSEHRRDCRHAGKRGGVSEGNPNVPAGKDLSSTGGAEGLHSQGQWKTEAVGHSHGAGPGGASGGVAGPRANLLSGLFKLFAPGSAWPGG